MAEYIDKQKAIDELCNVEEYNTRSIATIKDMKPADVRPVVRGRWVRHYCDEDGKYDGWGCDKCKEWYFFGPSKPNFCPNCGADMKEETKE